MKDQPLQCKIEGDELVIRIGISLLAFAAQERDPFYVYDNRVGDWVKKMKIVDEKEWAKDLAREIMREGEDGSSPLTNLLDSAAEKAVDDGSVAVWYPELGYPDPTKEEGR